MICIDVFSARGDFFTTREAAEAHDPGFKVLEGKAVWIDKQCYLVRPDPIDLNLAHAKRRKQLIEKAKKKLTNEELEALKEEWENGD